MAELGNVNKLGSAKGSVVEDAVNANFQGETAEVGLYLAMSRQAQREGFPEIGEALKSLAMDEAWHAARFAELNGKISESTKENLEKMLAGEQGANKGKKAASVKANEAGVEEAGNFFDESSKDEARHAKTLEGLLKRYF
ncbi:MAG: rubrerythrin family protein [Candidatus Scalindua sp.]|mgnify:CR=1 FL=1|jgi:rubrerythrin|nr:rubrerythrin family protein [Candidatus Scalindua sp.]MBT5305330.1 rubrerythrin family protein [Candidatus Scalindua sp.]MBT6050318.1 rubrerythrin family protein [Candidatus Scalindua sp.]MBT6225112.1 rubrerythrin family protein [Candidatus Scalindua sp.]MBT6561027.1 rubrerythrin family protein [Candidatus Scalindua sp.]